MQSSRVLGLGPWAGAGNLSGRLVKRNATHTARKDGPTPTWVSGPLMEAEPQLLPTCL